MTKGKHSVSIDDNIWELAKDQLDISMSAFFFLLLRSYLGEEDELSKLLRREAKLQNELDVVQAKICQLRDKRKKQLKQEHVLDKPMITVNRIHNKMGYIGRNQLRKIAHQNDIPPNILIEHCEKQKLNLRNFGELPKK